MPTKKKRIIIALSTHELDLLDKIKKHLNTKQNCKALAYALEYIYINDKVDDK